MEISLNVLYQAAVMFFMIVAGYLCLRIKLISAETNRQLSNFLLMVINPCILFISFQRDFETRLLNGLLIALALSFGSFSFMLLLTRVVLKKTPRDFYLAERFSCIYTNCGFFGTPLVFALFGSEGVLYLTAAVTAVNVLMWTQGVGMLTGKTDLKSLLQCLKTPAIIAIFLGIVLFVLRIHLPNVLYDPIELIGSTNTPIAMICAGAFIAQTDILKAFKKVRIYLVSAVRLLLIPIVCVAVFAVLPLSQPVALSVLIACATPPAVSCMAFTAKYDCNVNYSSELFSIGTVLSIATIPFICFLYEWFDALISPLLPF